MHIVSCKTTKRAKIQFTWKESWQGGLGQAYSWENNIITVVLKILYTAKNAEPAAQQDWTIFCCPRCSHLSTIFNNIVEPESGVTILFNIVDNCKQCGQQSIVQSCFHQYCINLSVFTRVDRLSKRNTWWLM
jgi:hypothetical protein